MYEKFFGLARQPFVMGFDLTCLSWSKSSRLIFESVRHVLMEGATGAVLDGEVGVGKTNLLHALSCDPELGRQFRIALVSNPSGDADDLFRWILSAFDLRPGPETGSALRARLAGLAREIGAGGRRPLLLLDEARSVSDAGAKALDELMVPAQADGVPLQLVCVGLPPLWERSAGAKADGAMRGPGPRFHLEPMSLSETRDYVRLRIRAVGGDADALFDEEAIRAIHGRAGGIPYLTNTLCNFCLYSAYRAERRAIDGPFAQAALADWLDYGPATPERAAAARGPAPAPHGGAPEAAPPDDPVERPETAGLPSDRPGPGSRPPEGPSRWRLYGRIAAGFVAGGVLGLAAVNATLLVGGRVLGARSGGPVEIAADGAAQAVLPVTDQTPAETGRAISADTTGRSGPDPAPSAGTPVTRGAALPWQPEPMEGVVDMVEWVGLMPEDSRFLAENAALPARLSMSAWPSPVDAVGLAKTLAAGEAARRDLAALGRRAEEAPAAGGHAAPSGAAILPAEAALQPAPFDPEAGERLFEEALFRTAPQAVAIGYARAAARGNGRAAYYLAQLYESGDGVAYSPRTAQVWYDFAARHGIDAPTERRATTGSQLPQGSPRARAMFSEAAQGALELVWQGSGPFVVELGPRPGRATAYHETDLSAVRLSAPPGLLWWRVSAQGGEPGEWIRIGAPVEVAQ